LVRKSKDFREVDGNPTALGRESVGNIGNIGVEERKLRMGWDGVNCRRRLQDGRIGES
jgi:hypothetical protein